MVLHSCGVCIIASINCVRATLILNNNYVCVCMQRAMPMYPRTRDNIVEGETFHVSVLVDLSYRPHSMTMLSGGHNDDIFIYIM